jgi:hypothetical protein
MQDVTIATLRRADGLDDLISPAPSGPAVLRATVDRRCLAAWNALPADDAALTLLLRTVPTHQADSADPLAPWLSAEALTRWPHARPALCAAGFDPASLERLFAWLPSRSVHALEAYSVFHHDDPFGDITRAEVSGLPAPFTTHLLAPLRGLPWRLVRSFRDIHDALGLGHDAELLGMVGRLVALDASRETLEWCHRVARNAAPRRREFLRAVLDTEAWRADAADLPGHAIDELNRYASDENFAAWSRCLLSGLRRGLDPSFLLDGFYLARHYAPRWPFDAARLAATPSTFDRKAAEREAVASGHDERALELWEAAAGVVGASR